jgi:hypothetical protein
MQLNMTTILQQLVWWGCSKSLRQTAHKFNHKEPTNAAAASLTASGGSAASHIAINYNIFHPGIPLLLQV